MNQKRNRLLLLALWGMDMSWLYGWAALTMLASFGQSFTQIIAISISGLAMMLTLFIKSRGWRIYQLIGIHTIYLLVASAWMIYDIWQPEASFYNFAWLREYLATPHPPIHWLQIGLAIFWCFVFWFAGTRLAFLVQDSVTVSNHFDLGVISLVFLHLMEMLLETKGGITLAGPLMVHTIFAFFAFSVPGFCLVRGGSKGKSDFIAGFKSIGVVLSFLALVLLLGGGLTTLFLPYMTVAAYSGVAVMKTIFTPIGNLILSILKFLIGRNSPQLAPTPSGPTSESQAHSIAGQQTEGWLLLWQKVLLYLVAGLGMIVVITLFLLLVWQLAWWLSRKTTKAASSPSPFQLFCELLHWITLGFTTLVRKIWNIGHRSTGPVQLYLSLLTWGRLSGLPLTLSETPQEYGKRLSLRFPAISTEIETIILAHNEMIYGETSRQPKKLKSARSALHRLRNPLLWPVRLKSLLLR